MNKQRSDPDHMRSLQILDELSKNGSLTQRDLSRSMGVALGLVNSYIKNLAKKGFITVKAIPPKRYSYYLTPKGFAEKTRLAYHLFKDYTRVYREAKDNIKKLLYELQSEGARNAVFAGVDEVTEIAYLSLQETDIDLVAVVDDDMVGNNFISWPIQPISVLMDTKYDFIIVTSYIRAASIMRNLRKLGIKENKIKAVFKAI